MRNKRKTVVKCRNCGAEIELANERFEWIRCPYCHKGIEVAWSKKEPSERDR